MISKLARGQRVKVLEGVRRIQFGHLDRAGLRRGRERCARKCEGNAFHINLLVVTGIPPESHR